MSINTSTLDSTTEFTSQTTEHQLSEHRFSEQQAAEHQPGQPADQLTDTVQESGTAEATQAASTHAPASATQPAREIAPPNANGNAFAITSFVLGIASIVSSWTFVAPIIGLIFGILALRRKTQERTLALWGVWLNVAMLALTVLAAVAALFLFGFALIAGAL